MKLRVSVATLNRTLFPHPQDGTLMLALEQRASVINDDEKAVRVRAQPFGGAVRILDATPLQELIGDIEFDSEQSRQAQDFRILIPPSDWESVKQFCLQQLENLDSTILESDPRRELIEEFGETLDVKLKPDQYTLQPRGFVIENDPRPTDNIYAFGRWTTRVYRIFEVCIIDSNLCKTMLSASQRYSERELGNLALKDSQTGGKGCANSILILPLRSVTESYLATPLEKRFQAINVEGHQLDESVLAVLEDIDILQYQKQQVRSWKIT